MSNTKYEVIEGSYLTAVEEFVRRGGRFFPQRFADSPSTILSGNSCVTIWDKDSRLLPKCQNAARQFGIEWEGQSPGRLARIILRDIVGLQTKGTSFSGKYRALALKGEHWHYTHVQPGYHEYLVEFDLKSAYFTSLFQGKTLLYHDWHGFIEDDGALENLRAITPLLPKFLRVTILGVLASHKMQFYTLDRSNGDLVEMKLRTHKEIKYGAAFNAAHKAVKRTYELMKKIHEIGGDSIKRIHTDSFAMSWETPFEAEREIFALLERNHYPCQVKAQGSSHFLSLNEGIIGNKIVGARDFILQQYREKEIKIPKHELDHAEMQRWIQRKLDIEYVEDSKPHPRKELFEKYVQLSIDSIPEY